MPSGRETAFHHNADSLRKAVEERCFACLHIWNGLSKEQQVVASGPQFEGFDCVSELSSRRYALGDQESGVLATLTFENGDDLDACDDDYGTERIRRGLDGHFAVLNSYGAYT